MVDPMAGGGSTIDACRSLDRRCLAYDVDPIRKDIKKWDIVNQGFPEEAKGRCNQVFLDSPYGSIIKDRLSKDSISSLYIEGVIQDMHALAK